MPIRKMFFAVATAFVVALAARVAGTETSTFEEGVDSAFDKKEGVSAQFNPQKELGKRATDALKTAQIQETSIENVAGAIGAAAETGFQLVRSPDSQCVRDNAECRRSCGTGRDGARRCRARCDDRLRDCLNGGDGDDGRGGGNDSWCVRDNAECRRSCGTGRDGARRCRARCDERLQDCLNGN